MLYGAYFYLPRDRNINIVPDSRVQRPRRPVVPAGAVQPTKSTMVSKGPTASRKPRFTFVSNKTKYVDNASPASLQMVQHIYMVRQVRPYSALSTYLFYHADEVYDSR